MKRKLSIAARFIAGLLLVHYAGVWLANFLVYRYMWEMPLWLYHTIRFVLDHTGNADILEPDDLSVIALLSTLIACWIVTAIVVIALYKIAVRLIFRYRRPHSAQD